MTNAEITEWSRKEADDLKARAPEGACYLLIAWPANIGLDSDAAAQLSSNLGIIESKEHLLQVLEMVMHGLNMANRCSQCGKNWGLNEIGCPTCR